MVTTPVLMFLMTYIRPTLLELAVGKVIVIFDVALAKTVWYVSSNVVFVVNIETLFETEPSTEKVEFGVVVPTPTLPSEEM
jgi:hypothetical protein